MTRLKINEMSSIKPQPPNAFLIHFLPQKMYLLGKKSIVGQIFVGTNTKKVGPKIFNDLISMDIR